MFPWIRELKIVLSNSSKTVTIDSYNITVTVNKYLSALKDEAVIEIKNFPYSTLIQIIQEKIYDVEIWTGYKNTGTHKIFDGGVSFISNRFDDTKTNTVIILCSSKLVARTQQRLITLNLESGINMYAALDQICKQAGVSGSISEKYQYVFNKQYESISSNFVQYLTSLQDDMNSYDAVINSDSILGPEVNIFQGIANSKRKFKIDDSMIELSMGFPRMTTNGLALTVVPVMQLMCGDILQINNSLIDVSRRSLDEFLGKSYYLDENGLYVIYQMEYSLQNRDSSFYLNLDCYSYRWVQLKSALGVT